MLFLFVLFFVGVSVTNVYGLDNTYVSGTSVSCNPFLPNPSSSNEGCTVQSFHYKQNAASDNPITMDYNLSKNIDTEKISMVTNYSRNGLTAQLGGYYIKYRNADTVNSSDLVINMKYLLMPWENFRVITSESIFIPAQQNSTVITPPRYTSSLETQYSINNTSTLIAQGSYTYLDSQKASIPPLCNPYSFETGINYADNSLMSLQASYAQVKDQNEFNAVNEVAKLTLKRKISNKIKTSLTIRKNFTSLPQENKASLMMNYAF